MNIGNENLLKEEINTFYPELRLSYSRKGFLTFKNLGVKFDLKTISQLQVTFSTRSGICLGKASPENLKETIDNKLKEINLRSTDYLIHNFSINTEYLFDPIKFSPTANEYSAEGKLVLNLISLGEKEVWFGLHRVGRYTTGYANSLVEIRQIKDSPSRANIKLAEIINLNELKLSSSDLWLDFGCSPGGSSAYLLSTGAKVWGIDTAKMDSSILTKENFKFIRGAVQDLSQEKLPDAKINWVHVDLNINPKQAIKEVLRLCKKYNSSLKGILFTVQIVKLEYVQNIEEFEEIFYDWGFQNLVSSQVPSHKKEYILIARR